MMGSIYKKGRDGYYYYQVYIFNNQTGKKDKKIFHSLGTKNFEEAQKQKIKLDKEYADLNQKKDKNTSILNIVKNPLIIIATFISFLILFFSLNFNPSAKNITPPEPHNARQSKVNHLYGMADSVNKKDTKVIKEENIKIQISSSHNKSSFNPEYDNQNILSYDTNLSDNKEHSIDNIIPSYKIEREEQISESFNQLKLYVTCSNSVNEKSFINLCRSLKKDYSNYNNLIISIYSNSENGTMLAKGSNKSIDKKALLPEWLFFYTFNPVEGEFYDNNPGNYLGAY